MAKITVHMIVKNEEQWIWYALSSVIHYVEQILIYDTGSKDQTLSIINEFNHPKIKVNIKLITNPQRITELRNEQIKNTKTDWFMLLDGDEVWPHKTIQELVKTLATVSSTTTAIVVKARVPVGDLYHYQPESAGKYKLLGKTGHFNIRIYRRLPEYQWVGKYPWEAFQNQQKLKIQDETNKLLLLKNEYWHMTHLHRSSVDTHRKRKLEIGITKKTDLPEVFFADRPATIKSPWVKFSPLEKIIAFGMRPLLKLKRTYL